MPPPGLTPAGGYLAATKNGRAAAQLCFEVTFDAPDRSGRPRRKSKRSSAHCN
jgi:hypothetical protein